MVKISPSNAGGVGLIPGQEAKVPHASAKKKKKKQTHKKQKEYITNSMKT